MSAEIAELKTKLAEARGLLDDVLGYSLDNTMRKDILAFLAELKAKLAESDAGWNEEIDTRNQVVAHNHELAAKLAKAREFILLHRTYYLHSYEADNFLAELGETKETK